MGTGAVQVRLTEFSFVVLLFRVPSLVHLLRHHSQPPILKDIGLFLSDSVVRVHKLQAFSLCPGSSAHFQSSESFWFLSFPLKISFLSPLGLLFIVHLKTCLLHEVILLGQKFKIFIPPLT